MSVSGRPLPSHPEKWSEEAKTHNVEGKRLNDVKVASGSKIGFKQFLLLRVLWKTNRPNRSKLPNTLKQYVSRAEELLENYLSWNTYCSSFSAPGIPEGTFAVPRLYQLLCANIEGTMRPNAFDTPLVARRTRSQKDPIISGVSKLQLRPPKTPEKQIMRSFLTPSPAVSLEGDDSTIEDIEESPSPPPITPASEVPEELQKYMFPPTADEQIVNTALVVFLNALTMHFNLQSGWTLHRKGFVADFTDVSFEARTDGYLKDDHGNAHALIEVKPITRAEKQNMIQMQESAQMVGWIINTPDTPPDRLRIHVSQDRHEIFLTFAEYDADYLRYLKNKRVSGSNLPFLTMRQHGPWNALDSGDMAKLGPILLAITLYIDDQIKGDQM